MWEPLKIGDLLEEEEWIGTWKTMILDFVDP